jgi:glycosyltransferase involved in cell wall biosynthesis
VSEIGRHFDGNARFFRPSSFGCRLALLLLLTRGVRIALVSEQYREHVHHLGAHLAARGHHVRIVTSGEGRERISLRREVVRLGRSLTARFSFGLERKLRQALEGSDLVHVHSPLPPLIPWPGEAPLVATFHDPVGRWDRLPLLDAVIAVSAAVARSLRPRAVEVIPDGVDCGAWTSLEPSTEPMIAGAGDERILGEAAKQLGARLVLIDRLTPADRARALQAAQVMAYTGRRAGELLPGLAAGLPIVAYDIEGVRELVIEGRHGYKVPPGDARALAQALARVLGDAELRKQMACEALKQASRYDWRWMGARVERVYRSIVGRRCVA